MPKPRPLLLVTLTATCLLLVAACGSSSTSTGSSGSTPPTTAGGRATGTTASGAARSDLTGSTWQLVSYQAASGTVPASSSPALLTFGPAGALSGSGGCNRITGRYTTQGGSLTIDLGAMTQMACADPAVDAQEQAMTAGLPRVRSFTVEGESLLLKDQSGATLFTLKAQSDGLPGTTWKATGVNNGREALVGAPETEQATLTFGPDGKLSGSTSCTTLTGTYTADAAAGTLAMTNIAAGSGACTGEAATFLDQYLVALGATTTYQREGATLTLRDAQGAMQATFTAGG